MNPEKLHRLMAVPRTTQTRLQIATAVCTLAQEHQDEALRVRHSEIAAIRRDLEEIPRLLRRACSDLRMELRSELRKYSPDQPRVPSGSSGGGQWTKEDEGASSEDSRAGSTTPVDESSNLGPQYAALDIGARTDAAIAGGAPPSDLGVGTNDGVVLAQNKVTPEGFSIQHTSRAKIR
jgi:hypothetical protein